MIDGLPAIIGATPTIATALALLYLIFTGRLVVKAQHEQLIAQLQKQVDDVGLERDTWRKASEAKDTTIKTLADSNDTLLETAEFSTKVMSALQLNNSGGAASVPQA